MCLQEWTAKTLWTYTPHVLINIQEMNKSDGLCRCLSARFHKISLKLNRDKIKISCDSIHLCWK